MQNKTRAKLLLASTSPELVNEVIDLVNSEGRGLIRSLFTEEVTKETVTMRPFFWMSPKYLTDEDVEEVWNGMALIIIAALKQKNFGNDEITDLFVQGLSLPTELAAPLAKQCETWDPLSGADANSAWSRYKNAVGEAFRNATNAVAGLINPNWEIDQAQDHDLDRLYEIKLVGKMVIELRSRARLMQAGLAIGQRGGLLALGDVEHMEQGDVDAVIGDVLRPFATNNLPDEAYGDFFGLFKKARKASGSKAKTAFDSAGCKCDKNGVQLTNSGNPALADSVVKASDTGSSGDGLAGILKGIFPRMFAGGDVSTYGDVVRDEIAGDIAREYGDAAAEAWRTGDVESLIGEIDIALGDIDPDAPTTGDVDLDAALQGEVEQDPYASLPVGGPLIRKMKLANLRRRLAKAKNKRRNQDTRQANARREQEEIARLKAEISSVRTAAPEAFDEAGGSGIEEPLPEGGGEDFGQENFGVDSFFGNSGV